MEKSATIPEMGQEFAEASLGDPRRVRRLSQVAEVMAKAPTSSFAEAMGDDAALEGTYRLLGSEHISAEAVLGAHVRQSLKRCSEVPLVLVVHDTTQFRLEGEPIAEQVGRLRKHGRGLFAHYSFAQSQEGRPLGVVALSAWKRGELRKGKRNPGVAQEDLTRESLRWTQGCEEVYERLYGKTEVVHVMDREGDGYETLSELVELGQRFVIRCCKNRNLDAEGRTRPSRKLYDELSQAPLRLEREVPLSKRDANLALKKKSAIYPSRQARWARLQVRACTLNFIRSNGQPVHLPPQTSLNFIEVREPDPPVGQPAVHWRLATTEPIDTSEQVERVVDIYRRRWLIEEYFKAIKTGCAFEKRPLQTLNSVLTALALFSAVAWRMLLLRWAERQDPDRPASQVLTTSMLLALMAVRAKAGRPLPQKPTAQDVYLAIAALGGHIKNNGPPGWLVLHRGFEKLLLLEQGWAAATTPPKTHSHTLRLPIDR